MKTQTMKQMMAKGMMVIFAITALMTTACSNGSGGGSASTVGITGIGYCSTGCSGFAAGPMIFNSTASSPYGTLTSPGIQVIADANGYQAVAASGMRPLVNGTYNAAVQGIFTLNQAVTCSTGVQVPAGTYTIEMIQMGQMQNGNYFAQNVNMVGPTTIAGSVWATFVDANLDNIVDPGSLIAIGFCGQWHDMNTH